MAIFTFGLLVKASFMMLTLALAALRLVKIELAVLLVAVIANVILNVLMIPPFGMDGAALASAVSFIVMMVLMLHYSWKIFRFRMPVEMYNMAVAAVIALAVVLLIKPTASSILDYMPYFGEEGFMAYMPKLIYLGILGILVAFSGAFFAMFSLLLKCFTREDITLMRKAMKRAKVPQQLIGLAERVASHGVSAKK
jgi:O-antigen/teichoic acid export membrane protein